MKVAVRPPKGKGFQTEVNPTDTDTDTVVDVRRSIGTLQGATVDLASQQILKDSSTLEENNVAENTSIVKSKLCDWCGRRSWFGARRRRKPFKKEKAADFKMAAVYEKMKALEVEQKAEEGRGLKKFSALITGLDVGAMEALRHHFEEDLSHHHRPLNNGPDVGAGATEAMRLYFEERCGSIEHLCFHHQDDYILLDKDSPFRAEIRGFDTGAKRLLEDHLKKNCGDVEAIIFPSPEYAYIDFVKEDSLYEALDLDSTIVSEHHITVKKAYYRPSIQYMAVVRGFDTRANVKKALRNHFKSCGWIEEISLDDGGAYIDFASLDSLFKALDLNNSTMDGGCSITVQPGVNFHPSSFRAEVSWPKELYDLDLWQYFEKCGGIAGIRYSHLPASHLSADLMDAALIHFTNLGSLEEALKLDNTCILGGNHRFFVKNACRKKCKKCSLNRRKQIGMKSNFDN